MSNGILKGAEFHHVALRTTSLDKSLAFYKALGMEECGKIPQGIYEPWGELKKYDEIILMKELT